MTWQRGHLVRCQSLLVPVETTDRCTDFRSANVRDALAALFNQMLGGQQADCGIVHADEVRFEAGNCRSSRM